MGLGWGALAGPNCWDPSVLGPGLRTQHESTSCIPLHSLRPSVTSTLAAGATASASLSPASVPPVQRGLWKRQSHSPA